MNDKAFVVPEEVAKPVRRGPVELTNRAKRLDARVAFMALQKTVGYQLVTAGTAEVGREEMRLLLVTTLRAMLLGDESDLPEVEIEC